MCCLQCGEIQWSVKGCDTCKDTKYIRKCQNKKMHPTDEGYFFYSYENQQYCSTMCLIDEQGFFKVAVHFKNLTLEADIDPNGTTVKEVQYSVVKQNMEVTASPPMIIPPRDAEVTNDGLCCDWDIKEGETNIEFIKRGLAMMEGDEPISTFFKSPCSEMTLEEYISRETEIPQPALNEADVAREVSKYGMVTDDRNLLQEDLLYNQLSKHSGTYTSASGYKMLSVRIVPLETIKDDVKQPLDVQDRLLEWFYGIGLKNVTNSMLKTRKNMWFNVGDQSLVVGTVNGSGYYEKFLADYAKKNPDIISPFHYDRAWILFEFETTEERDAWIQHFQVVLEASPPRSFGAVKYLMTTRLMKNDQEYKNLVNDESDDEEQRWRYYDDMILRYRMLKKHKFKKYDGSFKLPKLPKKKAIYKRKNRPKPIEDDDDDDDKEVKTSGSSSVVISSDKNDGSKRILFKFSREDLNSFKKQKKTSNIVYSEDSNSSWMATDNPYE